MTPTELKSLFAPFRKATETFDKAETAKIAGELFADDCVNQICHPLGDVDNFVADCLAPLAEAMPDLERRDMIVMAGTTPEGKDWIGCMGNYMGTFLSPFLDIPPTGHLAHMRYHEYYQVENGRITGMQAIWDIPELMMQAGAWPLAPQLGKFMCTPAPMTNDGLTVSGDGSEAMRIVVDMLTDLCKYPGNPDPDVMQMDNYWHPRFNWYGPAGIGTCRGKSGFRNWHQEPALRAMPDRKLDAMGDLMSHWFAEGDYACETGWPNMRLTITHGGWMGIAPSGTEILKRSLDFWRVEDGLIRENWVLVDLLDVYHHLGVDVFARMREFNKARVSGSVALPDWKHA